MFDKQWVVFRIVFTGFCTIISQMFDIFETNHIIMFFCCILFSCTSSDFWIQIVAIFVTDIQQPSHMVDTCDCFVTSF